MVSNALSARRGTLHRPKVCNKPPPRPPIDLPIPIGYLTVVMVDLAGTVPWTIDAKLPIFANPVPGLVTAGGFNSAGNPFIVVWTFPPHAAGSLIQMAVASGDPFEDWSGSGDPDPGVRPASFTGVAECANAATEANFWLDLHG